MVSDYGCRAAYLYVLRLDRHTIGEEFRKRLRPPGCSATARRAADAQSARWRSEIPTVAMTCTRDRAPGAIRDGCQFNLWQIGGDKELHHLGVRLALRVQRVRGPIVVELPAAISHGAPLAFLIASGRGFRSATRRAVRANAMLSGAASETAAAWRPGAQQLLFMRALIALDGHLSGATYRQIAVALFGAHAVRTRWRIDPTLKAQIRYLVAKARRFMETGNAPQ
jgi:hypothetical protein